jgi:hypothetical protein
MGRSSFVCHVSVSPELISRERELSWVIYLAASACTSTEDRHKSTSIAGSII